MSTSILAPYKSAAHGLAELLTLTMRVKDKALKGQIVLALARLEQTMLQEKCPEGIKTGDTK